MWRVTVVFLFTRICFFAAILFAINAAIPRTKSIAPFSELWGEFVTRLQVSPETIRIQELARNNLAAMALHLSPFDALQAMLVQLHLPAWIVVLVIANLFFILFLTELHALLLRMGNPEAAVATCILVLLWPGSLDLGLGSPLVFVCWLSMLVMRSAIDDRWINVGLGLGALALLHPAWSILLVPLLTYFFWFYQRHYPWSLSGRRLAFFLVPVLAVLVVRQFAWSSLLPSLGGTFTQIYQAFDSGNLESLFTRAYLGHWIAFAILLVGTSGATLSHSGISFRFIPPYFLLLLLGMAPLGSLAMRLPLAAVCLQGVAVLPSPQIYRLFQITLFVFAIFEANRAFAV